MKEEKGKNIKIYDKDMTEKENNLKESILVLVIFFLGFLVGYFVKNTEDISKTNQITNQNILIVQQEEGVRNI